MGTSTISGFTPLPVSYPRKSIHYIYARVHAHSKRSTPLPEGRTLFLVNVPPDATEREISLFFKPCGTVEKVYFDLEVSEPLNSSSDSEDSDDEGEDMDGIQDADGDSNKPRKRRKVAETGPPVVTPLPVVPRPLHKSGQCAHVVFLDDSSLQKAFTLSQKPRPWPTSDDEPSGLARYLAAYDALRPPLDVVKEHADTSVELYEYRLAKSKRSQASKYKKGEAIVDEDGFTLVTRGGAYGQTLGGGVAVASKKFTEEVEAGGDDGKRGKGRKKKEKKEKTNFYSFQKAEKQRKDLLNLRQRFEADKAKVEKLKQSRRFKPY